MKAFTDEEKNEIKEGTKIYALKLSIIKQQDIIDGTGDDLAGDNCALCIKYNKDDEEYWDNDCVNCPLYLDDNGCDEDDSLWKRGDREGLIEVFSRLIKEEEDK